MPTWYMYTACLDVILKIKINSVSVYNQIYTKYRNTANTIKLWKQKYIHTYTYTYIYIYI